MGDDYPDALDLAAYLLQNMGLKTVCELRDRGLAAHRVI
jgi:hypothetical protein